MTPEREEEAQRGLSRERLVDSALGLIQEEGLEGLSMRALAESLRVKAASLYWHVRDRDELLELLAEAILEKVRLPSTGGGWRPAVQAIAAALEVQVAAQKDASRVLLEAPDVLDRSDTFSALRTQLEAAGLRPAEAADVARMVMTSVIASRQARADSSGEAAAAPGSEVATLAVDTGSRGVVARAGSADMQTLIRVPHDRSTAASAVVRGERVTVRRLRGVGRGEIELNPNRPWQFKVQAPTWNTLLNLGGLDVRGVHVDSGAARVEVFLPRPRGVVPVHISSGVGGVMLHRPRGTAIVADISTGAVKVKLDDFAVRTSVTPMQWESEKASASPDRYQLVVSSGVVKIELDAYDLQAPEPSVSPPAAPRVTAATALEILLDGVEHRTKS
jgi:TetR/AcrR family transcriptional regulator, tetracycline repressor protein